MKTRHGPLVSRRILRSLAGQSHWSYCATARDCARLQYAGDRQRDNGMGRGSRQAQSSKSLDFS